LLNFSPSLIDKWLKRFEWMQQGEVEGLTNVEIALKANDLAAEPGVAEWEVEQLLVFFKEESKIKTKNSALKNKLNNLRFFVTHCLNMDDMDSFNPYHPCSDNE
jgi:hypothetical protein